jgi:hypothetical protein
VPEWAPPGKDHLVRSSSVVTEVAYEPRAVRYRTFDAAGEEVLRLAFEPKTVTGDGTTLGRGIGAPGWSFDPKTGVLRVRRSSARQVTIDGASSPAPTKRVR